MYPVILEIGPLSVRAYGLALAISFMFGSWLALRRGVRRGLPEGEMLALFWWIVIASVVGARIHYVLVHPDHFTSPLDAFRIWEGGLIHYGGFAAAVAASWVYLRKRGLPFLPTADAVAPSLALGEGITRIGCHFNGCCFGDVWTGPLAIHFPAGSFAARALGEGMGVWPSQLLLSGALFAVGGVILLVDRRRRFPGALFALFLVLEGIVRWAVDFTRYYEPAEMLARPWPLIESQSQVRAVVLIIAGLVFLIWARRRSRAV